MATKKGSGGKGGGKNTTTPRKRPSKAEVTTKDSKVVSILQGIFGKPKASAKKSRKLPPPYAGVVHGGTLIDTTQAADPYAKFQPPLAMVRYHKTHEADRPSDQLINAVCKAITLGVPIRAAFAAYGVPYSTYLDWLAFAQRAKNTSALDAFYELFAAVEVAEGQGEAMALLDARLHPELMDFILRTRYRRNFGKTMESSNAPEVLQHKAEVVDDMTDDEMAYILSCMQQPTPAMIDIKPESDEPTALPPATGTEKI